MATLVWFRNDLRVSDNPALTAALSDGAPVRAIHIEPTDKSLRRRGGASRWWLHHSLQALAERLGRLGIMLETAEGDTAELLEQAVKHHGATRLMWNRRYGPAERELDAGIKTQMKSHGVEALSFLGDVLVEPFEIATGAGKPYAVYTPFWNALRQRDIAPPLPAPKPHGDPVKPRGIDADYRAPKWSEKLGPHWEIGEAAAAEKLHDFLEHIADYPEGRDIPAKEATSKLSPHLVFGEISSRQIWHAGHMLAQHTPHRGTAIDKFLSELAWRDFNINQLYWRDDIAKVPMQPKYAGVEWRHDTRALHAWQQGRTGFPIVDAGMRELWATGFMQNRVRMLVASLLSKNLLIDWRLGEHWFWDTLCDADPANNPGNWQWVAGSGLDASPYFRIFNPVVQGERFDPSGDYVRQWVPEVAGLPDKWVHKPFEAPADVRGGLDYPDPIVDLKSSRERALEAVRGL